MSSKDETTIILKLDFDEFEMDKERIEELMKQATLDNVIRTQDHFRNLLEPKEEKNGKD